MASRLDQYHPNLLVVQCSAVTAAHYSGCVQWEGSNAFVLLTVSNSFPEELIAAQHEVQRKLGRVMLRLQQYERLLKAIAASSQIEGPIDELADLHAERVRSLSTKSLGLVKKEVAETLFATQGTEAGEKANIISEESISSVRVRLTQGFEVSSVERDRIGREFDEIVELRNQLVHHFLEIFDVWNVEGCAAADEYLLVCYQKVDEHFMQVLQWADELDAARMEAVAFMQTPEFLDLLLRRGPSLDEVVKLLKDAEAAISEAGWTALLGAIEFVTARAEQVTPRSFGFASWRHLLHASGQFEVGRRPMSDGTTATSYRSRLPN